MLFISLLLVAASVQHIIMATNSYKVRANGSDTESLEYYLNNTNKYFLPNRQLHFQPGIYYLNVDIVIENITNFSFIGEDSCKIRCTSNVSIVILNVSNFTLENINFENCNKNHSTDLHTSFDYEYVSISKPSCNASILLYNCTSVVINNISVLVTAGTTGIIAVNVRAHSTLTNISITVNCTICPTKDKHPKQINGILFYYDYWNNKTTDMELDNFQFTANGSCAHPLQYAIALLLFQNNTNISFIISNTKFENLRNVSALYYYGETCGIFTINILMFINCVISNNIGHPTFKMFELILYNQGCFDISLLQNFYIQQSNNISFVNSKFVNNHNITSMIHLTPASSRATTGFVYIVNSSFCNNNNAHFLNLESDRENVWQLSNYIRIHTVNISSNRHFEGQNLLSATNCWIRCSGNTLITNNSLYENIMKLHLSGTIFQHNITIVGNTARQMFYGSYVFIGDNTIINVSLNTVYLVAQQTIDVSARKACGFQFYSKKGNLDKLSVTKWSFKVIARNNIHMTYKHLLGNNLLYTTCQWLSGTAFHTRNSSEVYKHTFTFKHLVIDNTNKRIIPLSVCKCKNSGSAVDCYSPHLGSIFPGETLTIQLSVQKHWINHKKSSMAIVAENSLKEDNCSIVHASELSQSHFNDINKCNSYSYTLWPKNVTVKECQLFIGLQNMPEMFYVQIKPCPKGFTFQDQKKACYCDPLLNNKVLSITSCNVKDETVLRPANSWIYAHTDENSHAHSYQVSLYCPFHRCLPESSHLNLSNPDSQCQFHRTGVLCGKCKPGLSVILGASQCKQCSNIYLLLLIPFAISGIVMVIFLYIFNLTIWNGTINTLIFYVNIININISVLFPSCQSITCVIFSHLNFEFRITTCFYNGMDDYAKAWLSLLNSFYFISIAFLLIVLSRYFGTVQRLTAQRALPVLATLILISYTKIVLTVCNVLFRYSTITHLPSNKAELIWTTSTTTPLFGLKFSALFTVCIILLLILLPFNVILLFTRKLSYFKLVVKLKPLLDTYFSAYKDKAYYWTGLLLLVRVIVYVSSVLDEDTSFITISILLAGLLCLHGIIQPFKNKFHNIQESVAIVNLLAVHAAKFYNKNFLGLNIPEILLIIGLVYFIIAIIIHCLIYRWKNVIHKSMKRLQQNIMWICTRKSAQENTVNEMESLSSRIADVTCNYNEFQEPLVEFDA